MLFAGITKIYTLFRNAKRARDLENRRKTNLQKADVNLNIGRLLLKYGKNKGPDE